MAGQGTVALEILAAAPEIDTLVVPIGGGGLIAGISVAAERCVPICASSACRRAAPTRQRWRSTISYTAPLPSPATIADGLLTRSPGERTLPIIRSQRGRSGHRFGRVDRRGGRALDGARQDGGRARRRGRAGSAALWRRAVSEPRAAAR